MTLNILKTRTLRPALTLACLSCAALLSSATAHAQFSIVPTFGTSITSNPDAAGIESTITAALSFYTANITTSSVVTIDFESVNTGLGQSSTYNDAVNYSDYVAALNSHLTGDTSFLQYLPTGPNNPVNGGTQVTATLPNLRALGFANENAPAGQFDSTVSLNTGISYDNRTPVAGKYDLYSTVQHEVNEVLGLGSTLDGLNNGDALPANIGPMDLYRYSGSGVRSFNTNASTAAYFSLDNGTTSLVYFNQKQGGDFHDWASSGESFQKAPEVQDANGYPAASNMDFSNQPTNGANEIFALHGVGYNFKVASTPAPSSALVLLLGAVPGVILLRRRKSRHA